VVASSAHGRRPRPASTAGEAGGAGPALPAAAAPSTPSPEPFTKAQLARLAKELEGVGFRAGAPTKRGDLSFANHELGATALLTARGLYLTASGEEAIAELLMFGSELTEDGELARFDPQEGKRGSWE
jgi:hypothetical protein